MNLTEILEELKNSDILDNYDKLYKLISNYDYSDHKDFVIYSNESYNKVFLYSTYKFDLVLICWKKGQNTKIHDHPDYCCILKVLDGLLMEEEFQNNNGEVKMYNTHILKKGSIANKKQNKIVHRIIPLEDSVSLHLYIPGLYKPNYFIEKIE